jgi:hypothetical protein
LIPAISYLRNIFIIFPDLAVPPRNDFCLFARNIFADPRNNPGFYILGLAWIFSKTADAALPNFFLDLETTGYNSSVVIKKISDKSDHRH